MGTLQPETAMPDEGKGVPDRRRDGIAFTYSNVDVFYNEARLVSLNQMWEAAGAIAGKEPWRWAATADAKGFIADLAMASNLAKNEIWKSRRGQHLGGTWAHWQIGLAYAKYLSHEFHRYVNEAFREWAEEEADPDLKARRAVEGYRRKGWDDRKIIARLEGIVQRNLFTDTLKEHGVNVNGRANGYALCTDTINKEVLGMGAKELKISRGFPAKAKTRDCLQTVELSALNFAEALALKKVEGDCTHGNDQCCAVCEQSGRAVRQAMISMGVV